jgi:signal transduction histidine kinase
LPIIITNIISNALKYSNENGVVEIQLKKSKNRIECVISDSGIGIPEEDLDKVFHPFFRTKAANQAHIKGMGLGLSIVQRLCTLLTIDLKVISTENIGTRVYLFFS